MAKGRVAVFRVSTSVSATPVKPGKTYPLSVLDHAMAKHRIRAVWYFAEAGEGAGREALKESLTEVLNHYPAVTGRLVKGAEDGNWVVKCNDAGLRVVEATVSVGMDEWFRTADEDEEEELTYWEEMGDDPYIWSPFYVQREMIDTHRPDALHYLNEPFHEGTLFEGRKANSYAGFGDIQRPETRTPTLMGEHGAVTIDTDVG